MLAPIITLKWYSERDGCHGSAARQDTAFYKKPKLNQTAMPPARAIRRHVAHCNSLHPE
jgi:hypothetical protein